MLARRRICSFAAGIVLAIGCASGPQVRSSADPTADFRTYTTYAFVPAHQLQLVGTQMPDFVTRSNLEAAIARHLQAKGLAPAGAGNPTLLVSYFADVYLAANNEREGEIVIYLHDAATEVVVWRAEGWARNPMPKDAEQLLEDMFRKYPAPGR